MNRMIEDLRLESARMLHDDLFYDIPSIGSVCDRLRESCGYAGVFMINDKFLLVRVPNVSNEKLKFSVAFLMQLDDVEAWWKA